MAPSQSTRLEPARPARGLRIAGLLIAAFVAGYLDLALPTWVHGMTDLTGAERSGIALLRPLRGATMDAFDFALVITAGLQLNRLLPSGPAQPLIRYAWLGLASGCLFLLMALALALAVPGCSHATNAWGHAIVAVIPVDTACGISLWLGVGLDIGAKAGLWADVVSPLAAAVAGMLIYAGMTGVLKRQPTAGEVFD